jgi:hypothetical protein
MHPCKHLRRDSISGHGQPPPKQACQTKTHLKSEVKRVVEVASSWGAPQNGWILKGEGVNGPNCSSRGAKPGVGQLREYDALLSIRNLVILYRKGDCLRNKRWLATFQNQDIHESVTCLQFRDQWVAAPAIQLSGLVIRVLVRKLGNSKEDTA